MHALLGNGEKEDLSRRDTWLYTVAGKTVQALSTFLKQVKRLIIGLEVSANQHRPLMISVKKNRWTALSKALGPFLYGFNSFPWVSYSRGRGRTWLVRSSIPLVREPGFGREACSAWEHVEFDIRRRRETIGERETAWRAAKTIRGCNPTTRLGLENMVRATMPTTEISHIFTWSQLWTRSFPANQIHRKTKTWTAMSSTAAKTKAKTKAPPLSDQGMHLAVISRKSHWTRSARDPAKLYSIAKWTTSPCKENRWTWVRSRRTYVRLFLKMIHLALISLTNVVCAVWSFLH